MGILIYSADPNTGESLGELEPPGRPWEDLLAAVEEAASELRCAADDGETVRLPRRIPASAFWRNLFFAWWMVFRRGVPSKRALAAVPRLAPEEIAFPNEGCLWRPLGGRGVSWLPQGALRRAVRAMAELTPYVEPEARGDWQQLLEIMASQEARRLSVGCMWLEE